MRRSFLIPALAFAFGTAAAPLEAQNEYEAQVILQLEAAAEIFVDAGAEPLVWDSGALDEGYAEEFEVTLQEGFTYALVGVCDEDCSDLDLTLYDGDGYFVVEDTEVDDAPVIEFTVTRSGSFTLDVTMYTCGVEPCYYGVALFAW